MEEEEDAILSPDFLWVATVFIYFLYLLQFNAYKNRSQRMKCKESKTPNEVNQQWYKKI